MITDCFLNCQISSNPDLLTIATDSEWDDSRGRMWLCTTFAVSNGRKFIFVTSDIPQKTKDVVAATCQQKGFDLEFVSMSDLSNLLSRVLELLELPLKAKVRLLMYYSARDLEYSISWDFCNELMLAGKESFGQGIQKKRNIRGQFDLHIEDRKINVTIRDLYGWNPQGLNKLANSVGVKMESKGDMDEYKTRMFDGLINEPQKFISYSMGDTTVLLDIEKSFVEQVRWVQHDVIGLPLELCHTIDDIPTTTGSLVAATLLHWVYAKSPLMDFALKKLGLLDMSHAKYKQSRAAWLTVNKRYKDTAILTSDLEALKRGENCPELNDLEAVLDAKYDFLGLGQGSVGYFAKQFIDTSTYAALVQGGRCNNERPTEYRLEYGADIDLQSAYGSALRGFIYPVGLPTVIATQARQEVMTLGRLLGRIEKELVEGCWQIVVSGELKFTQDLIYSKIVSAKEINKAANAGWDKAFGNEIRDDDLAHIPGDFALLRKEVVNGIITSDVLKVVRAVASDKELNEIMALEVVTAVYYAASSRCDSVEEWLAQVVADKGVSINKNNIHGITEDSRTRAWLALPLEGFIGRLVETRNELKRQKKQATDPEEKARLDAKQEMLKLFVNTTYGVLASPFFLIGNTTVANNITAKARVGAWMLNKALHTRQSITDGGMYSLLAVPVLREKAKLPGLASLADNTKWVDKKNYTRVLEPLAGREWKIEFDALEQEIAQLSREAGEAKMRDLASDLNQLALAHIEAFWGRFGLTFPFQIEHKDENSFTVAAYMCKGHYALKRLQSDKTGERILYKVRGSKRYNAESGLREDPMFELLENIIEGSNNFPAEKVYDHKHLLSIGEYIQTQLYSNGFEAYQGKRPGDEVIQARVKRINNTHCPVDTVAEFKRRSERKTHHRGQDMEFFEKIGSEEGTEKMVRRMNDDNLK